MTDTNDNDRLDCYDEISDCMRTRLLDYYNRNKHLIGDARSRTAIEESVKGLDCIFQVLDGYNITKKPKAILSPRADA